MSIRVIEASGKFKRQYRKLPKRIKDVAKQKEFIFRNNPFDSRLDTHKLHGKEKEFWAFSISGSYRIKFLFLNSEEVLFLEIGTHNIYN